LRFFVYAGIADHLPVTAHRSDLVLLSVGLIDSSFVPFAWLDFSAERHAPSSSLGWSIFFGKFFFWD